MIIAGYLLGTGFLMNGETGTVPALETGLPSTFPADSLPPLIAAPVAGSIERAAPIDIFPQYQLSGAIIPSFGDLFFNRIHVLPNVLNVGNLANNQTRRIEIFNAFIAESKTLESVTENGNLSGIEFDIETPEVFAPLASKFHLLTIRAAGAPNFNGFYSFGFDTATAPDLSVFGQRIIPFVFPHNWSSLPVETIEFFTKIYEMRADYETAQKLRAYPRRELKYRHTIIETSDFVEICENKAEMQAVLYSWLHRVFAVPVWEDLLVLAAELEAGALSIPAQTLGFDFDAGSYILLWRTITEFELVEIAEVQADKIILARGTQIDWQPATLVLPARLARLANIEFTHETEEILEFEADWIIEPNERSINRILPFPAPVYRGFPVYLSALRFSEQFKIGLRRKQTIFDYKTGTRGVIASGVNPRGNFPAAAVMQTRREIAEFYGFLEARAGKLNPCWFPSWAKDFQLTETAGINSTSITIKGNRFSNVYAADANAGKNRRDLMITWLDGATLYCRVQSASIVNSESEILLLDKQLPKELNLFNIDRISFLKFARLEADRIQITKETTNVTRAELALRELVAAE